MEVSDRRSAGKPSQPSERSLHSFQPRFPNQISLYAKRSVRAPPAMTHKPRNTRKICAAGNRPGVRSRASLSPSTGCGSGTPRSRSGRSNRTFRPDDAALQTVQAATEPAARPAIPVSADSSDAPDTQLAPVCPCQNTPAAPCPQTDNPPPE